MADLIELMMWDIIKAILMTFSIFIVMGIVGNLIGALAFTAFNMTRSNNINGFLKLSIFISFIIGAFFFMVMGMFYASFALFLSTAIPKWFAITLVSIVLIIISKYTNKEIRSLHGKNILFSPSDFYHKGKYLNYSQVVNENILLGFMMLIPAFIIFLIWNNLADKFSIGLNSILMSFF